MAPKKRLGEMLIDAGVIDETQLKAALGHQRQWGVRLGQALVDLKLATEADIVRALSVKFGFGIAALDALEPYALEQALALLPRDFALRNNVFPMAADTASVTVAMSDPTNLAVVDEVRFRTGRRVKVCIGGDREVAEALRRHYPGDEAVEAIALDLDLDDSEVDAIFDPFGGGSKDALEAFYSPAAHEAQAPAAPLPAAAPPASAPPAPARDAPAAPVAQATQAPRSVTAAPAPAPAPAVPAPQPRAAPAQPLQGAASAAPRPAAPAPRPGPAAPAPAPAQAAPRAPAPAPATPAAPRPPAQAAPVARPGPGPAPAPASRPAPTPPRAAPAALELEPAAAPAPAGADGDGATLATDLRAAPAASSFTPREAAVLAALERLAGGAHAEPEILKPAQAMAALARLLLRKGVITERELLDELVRK
jgi:type II secretion system (T2SS) protein E